MFPSHDPEVGVAIQQFVKGRLDYRHDLDPLPMVTLSWILLGGHLDGEFVQERASWRYNAHYALFDRKTLKWYLSQVGLQPTEMKVNSHPNILCWAVKQ